MSGLRNGDGTASGAAIGTVWPWQTLASLGITENDLTVLPDTHGPAGAGPAAPVGSAGGAYGGFAGASPRSRTVPVFP